MKHGCSKATGEKRNAEVCQQKMREDGCQRGRFGEGAGETAGRRVKQMRGVKHQTRAFSLLAYRGVRVLSKRGRGTGRPPFLRNPLGTRCQISFAQGLGSRAQGIKCVERFSAQGTVSMQICKPPARASAQPSGVTDGAPISQMKKLRLRKRPPRPAVSRRARRSVWLQRPRFPGRRSPSQASDCMELISELNINSPPSPPHKTGCRSAAVLEALAEKNQFQIMAVRMASAAPSPLVPFFRDRLWFI